MTGWALVIVFFVLVALVGNARLKTRPRLPDPRFATEGQKAVVFLRDHGRCRHCGRQCVRTLDQVDWQANFDHVTPWSWGAPTTVENLQLLCRKCNMKKGARFAG